MADLKNAPLAVQLYSVRDLTAKDFVGTLKRVAEIGYKHVELAGMGNLGAAELRAALDDLGMQVVGSHIGIDRFESELDKVFLENQTLGNTRLVIPWLHESRRGSAAAWVELARALNLIGARCKDHGFQLCYHNHAFEFQKFDGHTGFDLLFENSDPALVKAEVDAYWVKDAGYDPIAVISRLAGRVPLVHVKDMTADTPHTYAEIGEGVMDYTAIVRACHAAHVEGYVVEQDQCLRPSSLECISISYRNMQGILQTA